MKKQPAKKPAPKKAGFTAKQRSGKVKSKTGC